MPFINSLFSWINIKRLNQIDEMRKDPVFFQHEEFNKLIKKGERTEFGKKYDFESITHIKTFQQRVPFHKYDDLKPDIERMIKGEANILWPKEVKWYAKSSGTTSDKSKYIPVSKDSMEDCHFKAGKDVYAIYTDIYPDNKVFSGKSLTLGGSHQVSPFSDRSQVGDLSAIYLQHVPFFFDLFRTPDTSIALLDEFEEKINKIAEVSVEENVTSIVGVPSWNLIMLKRVLEVTGKSNILEVWPNFELFVHGGINFDPYREQFRRIIPREDMRYMETYNASEGFFAIQDDLSSPDMLLMMDYGIFYEFIPMEDIESSNPKVYTVDEVETNKNYAVVISTNGGLWRYIIGDTVQFTSLYPHKVRISGRTKHYINAFGEELMVDNAEKALKEACQKTGAIIHEYTVAPVFMGDKSKGRHQWMVEFDHEPDDLNIFSEILDQALQKVNSDYEAKRRRNATLEPLELVVSRKGLFLDWMKKRGKLGGQNKVPRLANSRTYMDELIAMNQ
ncbi:GH3 auxin-responsive promoter family protein [Saccharicrinis sp. FJH62]|uniref:GH3 auxin-responsive promoter family protein n=1 Tax=Saccharicrinis sp. FJH62 TaxID=3344657 RepID=UPI0035D506C4